MKSHFFVKNVRYMYTAIVHHDLFLCMYDWSGKLGTRKYIQWFLLSNWRNMRETVCLYDEYINFCWKSWFSSANKMWNTNTCVTTNSKHSQGKKNVLIPVEGYCHKKCSCAIWRLSYPLLIIMINPKFKKNGSNIKVKRFITNRLRLRAQGPKFW